jgi:hypothetical protein
MLSKRNTCWLTDGLCIGTPAFHSHLTPRKQEKITQGASLACFLLNQLITNGIKSPNGGLGSTILRAPDDLGESAQQKEPDTRLRYRFLDVEGGN